MPYRLPEAEVLAEAALPPVRLPMIERLLGSHARGGPPRFPKKVMDQEVYQTPSAVQNARRLQ